MTDCMGVLVVDDERVVCELVHSILAGDGYSVASASTGLTALRLLQEQPDIGVLLTDVVMPEMDGIRLIREARKICPHIIPVIITGFATLEMAREAVKEGVYDYILKPFSATEARLAVSRALRRRRVPA